MWIYQMENHFDFSSESLWQYALYMCMHVCMQAYVHVHAGAYICMRIDMYICMHIDMYVYVYIIYILP